MRVVFLFGTSAGCAVHVHVDADIFFHAPPLSVDVHQGQLSVWYALAVVRP